MDKKNKTILIISIIGLILVVAGASYAYFSARITGLESASTLSMTAGTLEIEYSEGDENITASNIYPRPEAWLTKTITLRGKNTTQLKMNYSLGLVITTNEFEDGYLTYTLTNNTTSENGVPISTHTKTINQSGTQILGYGQFDTTGSASEEHTYTLQIFFKDNGLDQNESQGATFNARITVADYPEQDLPGTVPAGWSSASATSLLGAIKNNSKNNTKLANGTKDSANITMTIPGQQIANRNEGLRSAIDDYGTSYYYRGAVENNYVSFGDMCWRIVRVDGNGNIKLVLYNYKKTADRTGDNASNPCHANHDATDAAFARYDDTTNGSAGKSAFNTNGDQNAYVGLKYGTPGSGTYEAEHNGNNLSTILTNLETWYSANLNSEDSKIATVAYCNDKRVVSDTTYDPSGITPTGLGYGQEPTYYQTTQRLNPANTAAPVLTCLEGVSRVEGKIGLLSADEVAYAGAISYTSNNSYLNKNAGGYWWTSSPSGFDGDYAVAWGVTSGGSLDDGSYVGSADGLRPVVSLLSTARITGGTGTQASPFTIE